MLATPLIRKTRWMLLRQANDLVTSNRNFVFIRFHLCKTHNAKELHMDVASKFITPGILFLLTLAFGLWLSHSGKPLNTVFFTAHKLIALAAVIFTGIVIYL